MRARARVVLKAAAVRTQCENLGETAQHTHKGAAALLTSSSALAEEPLIVLGKRGIQTRTTSTEARGLCRSATRL